MDDKENIIIIGGGIGGLALALSLHQAGVPCRVYEAAAELKQLGVGINLLPHAMKALSNLGLGEEIAAAGIPTREYRFYTRQGQLVFTEPRGRHAGYDWPQVSIHRGALHAILAKAVQERLGADALVLGRRCVRVEQSEDAAIVHFIDSSGAALAPVRGNAAIACDGVHSVLRAQMHPSEAVPRYEGTTQYRGTTRYRPFLTGATMFYMGTYETGKLIMYPIKDNIDAEGRQLINWVIEITRPSDQLLRDWNRPSRVEEFIDSFAHCSFDWLDIPDLLRSADAIYEYPMVDQDPLSHWTEGRLTLLGDAAHPMMPRGSNGAAQAILDAATLAGLLGAGKEVRAALKEYEAVRLHATGNVVLANREIAPDAILRVVEERTGGQPFERIEDVISHEELAGWQERYRQVAGFAARELRGENAQAA